jgi:ankyrin repeat protein
MSPELGIFQAIAIGKKAGVASCLEADPALIRARNEQGDSVLLAAIYAGRQEIFEFLLEKGAPVDLFEASALGQNDIVAGQLEQDPELIRAYSHDGWTALHLAAFFGRREMAALLIDRGAPIDARSRQTRFARENTPLHAAAANRQTAVAELLIERGADVNARDGSGFTPLGLAANSRNDLLISALLEHGASIT